LAILATEVADLWSFREHLLHPLTLVPGKC